MDFTKLKLSDKALIERWLVRGDSLYSVSDFATLYEWDVNDRTVYNICDDVLTVRNTWNGRHVYFCPVVPDDRPLEPYLARIREHEAGDPYTVGHIPVKYAEELKRLEGYGALSYDRDDFDYIYNTADLITLSGKKFHSKRNFVHRFCTKYEYEFLDYEQSDLADVSALYDDWRATQPASAHLDAERAAMMRALAALKELDMRCGLLRVEGRLVALGVVSVSQRGMGQVHFEKARIDYDGAYAAINQLCASRYLSETAYINRQEDMGSEGLRAAKLSYHPVMIAGKYKLGTFEL